jgi:hypothetical protein
MENGLTFVDDVGRATIFACDVLGTLLHWQRCTTLATQDLNGRWSHCHMNDFNMPSQALPPLTESPVYDKLGGCLGGKKVKLDRSILND